jgi:hypothetical protein
MNKCINCDYWSLNTYYQDVKNLGDCHNTMQEDKAFDWGENGEYIMKGTNIKMFTYDGSSYMSGLRTLSDFGCSEWKDKNDI